MPKGSKSSKSDSSRSNLRGGRKSFERDDSRLERGASSDTRSRSGRSQSDSSSRGSHVGRGGKSSRIIRRDEE